MKLYKLFFVANSFLLLISIFLINNEILINWFFHIQIDKESSLYLWLVLLSYSVYLGIPLFLSWLQIKWFSKLDPDEFKALNTTHIEPAGVNFLAIFLGYVFVGVSISNIETLWYIYGIVIVLCCYSEMYLYDPMLYLLGYKFYFLSTKSNRVLFITKQSIKLNVIPTFTEVGRLNDFTYIDLKR